MNLLGGIFKNAGSDILKSVSQILDEIITNKEEIIKAKSEAEQFINKHIEEMQQKSIEIEKLYLDNIANARDMQKQALLQDDLFSKRFIYFLSAFVLVSATSFGIGLFFWSVPEGNKRLVEMFADIYLFAGAILVLQFFFGSSKSSMDKNDFIKHNLK